MSAERFKFITAATTLILLAAFLAACATNAPKRGEADAPEPARRILVFSKTAGFRHDSIAAGIDAIKRLGRDNRFEVEAAEDAGAFTNERLASFAAVFFLNTTGDILNDAQQNALQAFIRSGRGFVGIHSAADTEPGWPWYGELVRARFASHPAVQKAAIDVIAADHPSTRMLPRRWERTDEWYNFSSPPANSVTILATLDEGTYSGGAMGSNHPIAWCHEFDGGRVWYTACGHTIESFSEPLFLEHLRGGIEWAAGWKR